MINTNTPEDLQKPSWHIRRKYDPFESCTTPKGLIINDGQFLGNALEEVNAVPGTATTIVIKVQEPKQVSESDI